MGEQGIGDGAAAVAGGGVDDHPAGLIDDQQMLILVNDIQCDRFGLEDGRWWFGYDIIDAVARLYPPAGRSLQTPNAHPAGLDIVLNLIACPALQVVGQPTIQALTLAVVDDKDFGRGGQIRETRSGVKDDAVSRRGLALTPDPHYIFSSSAPL